MFEIATDLALFLMLAAFMGGFIDSIAGGGGLITMPALLLAGLSPVQALATNKLQSSFGSGTAALAYARAGHVRPREQLGMALVSALAAAGGALTAHLLPPDLLGMIIPFILIGVAAFFALRKGLSDADSTRRLGQTAFTFTAVPAIAAYDGLLGPGTGSFFMMAFVLLAGYGMLKATAHTKFLNFASNLGGLAMFIHTGAVLWWLGFAMAFAQTLGAMVGSHLAMRVGVRLIRPLLVVTSTAMALRLLWQSYAG